MHINVCKTKILFGSLAAKVNHRSHQNPLPAIQGNLPSLKPFIFIVFSSFLFPLLDHLAQLFLFHSLLLQTLFIHPHLFFFQPLLLQKGGKIYLQVWKKLNSIERNCQFQFTIHNEAQQEKVSQVERSVKHSKIGEICERQFCWNSHDNTWK